MEKLESLVLVIGEKDVNSMKSNIFYTDEPMELGEVVEDFLPPPEALIPKKHKVEVTLELDAETVNLLKLEAEKKHISYQKIITLLVDNYVKNG
jgi:hypothetical protein